MTEPTTFPAESKEDRAKQLVALDNVLSMDLTDEGRAQATVNRAALVAVMVEQDAYIEPAPVESAPAEQEQVYTEADPEQATGRIARMLKDFDPATPAPEVDLSRGGPPGYNPFDHVAPLHSFEDGTKLYQINGSWHALKDDKQLPAIEVVDYLRQYQNYQIYQGKTAPLSEIENGTKEVLYHTFNDGTQMYVGGEMHITGARFVASDGGSAGPIPKKYSAWEAELKAVGKSMTPLRDAQDAQAAGESDRVSAEVAPGTPTASPVLKYALCIPAWQRFIQRDQWTPVLLDRFGPHDFCETNNDFLQILPYITVQDQYGRLFSYKRGRGGDEQALFDLRSLGGGGHIDSVVPIVLERELMGDNPTDLDEHIAREAQRELGEEFGLEVTLEAMLDALRDSFIMYIPKTPVDAKHLAISMTITVEHESQLTKMEAGHIEEPMWMDRQFATLQCLVADMVKPEAIQWKFETWSQMYLQITQGQEALLSYMRQLGALQDRFEAQRAVVDLWAREVTAKFPDSPTLGVKVNLGTDLYLEANGVQTPISVPAQQFVHIHVSEKKLNDGATVPLYTWFVKGHEVVYTTTNFTDWEGPIDMAGDEPF